MRDAAAAPHRLSGHLPAATAARPTIFAIFEDTSEILCGSRLIIPRGGTGVSRSENPFCAVSWVFAAGSAAWRGPSRGAVVARLPLAEVPVRPAGGPGSV